MSCVFCKIVSEEKVSKVLYKDERVVAFLDSFPLAKGHTLVVPRVHAAKVEELSEEDAAALLKALYKLIRPVCEAVGAPDSTIAVNNGPASGQEIPHAHFHIIPRVHGDHGGPIHALFKGRPRLDSSEMNDIAERIRLNLR